MGTKTQKLSNVVDQIVEWQSVVVADGSTNTTAVSGRGYFVDTSAGAHTVNLPASPKIGDIIRVSLITAGNELTIGRNGNNINGSAADITTSADGDAFELVYVNASEGWKSVGQITAGTFIEATGGTITESGDYKIHTFTGDGCFVVSSLGNADNNPLGGPSVVDYLVVAGGGSGFPFYGGGGGAGGYRESHSTPVSGCYTASPLATPTGITVSTTTYPVTVGGGGASPGVNGSNSVFSTITSTGGGYGGKGADCGLKCGQSGGSGGGGGTGNPGGAYASGGSGNTPPVSPPQGNSGGGGNRSPATHTYGGGGGGAGQTGLNAGSNGQQGGCFGKGGDGVASAITGSSVTRAGGGGGAVNNAPAALYPAGGSGGGGNGGNCAPPGVLAGSGTSNTGGGGGGGANTTAGTGGKGIVIIRYKFQ